MTSPAIKVLVSLAGVSIVYACVQQIRMTGKARQLRAWVEQEQPEPWSQLNPVARNWHGGLPGLKLLHRQKVVDDPEFARQFGQLRVLERQMLYGIAVGAACIALTIAGFSFWGWVW